MINKAILVGNLGDDVKMHHFEGGNCIGRFPIATSRHWKDRDTGEKKEKTTWHNIIVRNKQAENCAKFLAKGKRVYIEGSIENRSYQGEDGKDVWVTEINARVVQFLSERGADSQPEDNRGGPGSGEKHAGQEWLDGKPGQPADELTPEAEDDLPF